MAKMKKRTFEREYVQVPNETAQASQVYINKELNENPIPLESKGLLLNLWSYPESFDVNKTELYKRFAYNKERSVKRAWKFLIDAGYMIEYKYRVGKKWEYEYIFNILPYTEEQRQIIWQEAIEEYGEIWGLEFEDCKMKSSKCGPQSVEESNTLLKQDLTKAKQTKTKDKNLVNKGLENLPEKNLLENKTEIKKEIDPPTENFKVKNPMHTVSDYDGTEPYGDFLENIANEYYAKFATGRWSKKQWTLMIGKLSVDIISSGVEIGNHKGYIYNCLKKIAYSHDLKYGKIESDLDDLPFHYNWLDEEEE